MSQKDSPQQFPSNSGNLTVGEVEFVHPIAWLGDPDCFSPNRISSESHPDG
jgi:hypothetical protein